MVLACCTPRSAISLEEGLGVIQGGTYALTENGLEILNRRR